MSATIGPERQGRVAVAVDLGAQSGRVVAVELMGNRISLSEVSRFANYPICVHGTWYWDILRLWGKIEQGVATAHHMHPISMGVDACGVDFALLDGMGRLLANPVHYRDRRTEGMIEHALEIVTREELYTATGIQFMSPNTLYQMLSLVRSKDPILQAARTFLTIPDLVNYWLTGRAVCEFTNATTTQFYNPRRGAWATDILDRLGIATHILPAIVPPGTPLGQYQGVQVIAPACHDTGSAVAGVPALGSRFAYISSGTWSLVGLEINEPLINQQTLAANLTNEGGVQGAFRLLKNVPGLWLIEQCRASWEAQGRGVTYDQLEKLTAAAPRFRAWIDVNHPLFLNPGDIPSRIAEYCTMTRQDCPQDQAAILRCIMESLAFKYRQVMEQLLNVSGREVDVIHVVGGGSRNRALCQMTADVLCRPVVAGPAEAAALGNALAQFIAHGDFSGIAEARQVAAGSLALNEYQPCDPEAWDAAYERFTNVSSATQTF